MGEKRDRLKEIIRRYSAEAPIVDVAEIRNYYRIEYGSEISKHTVIDTLKSLKTMGQCDYDELIDLQGHKIKTNIIYKRDIVPFEAKLLADQIAALAYIPIGDRKRLILRLRDVAGASDKRGFDEFDETKILEDNLSTQFMETLQRLYAATYIEHRQLSFIVNKNQYEWQESESPTAYSPVHPLSMAFHNGFYYLYCHLGESDRVYSFRVDLIKNVETLGDAGSREMRISEDELAMRRKSPFVGKTEKVVVRFDPTYTTYVLDRFGYNTAVRKSQKSGWSEIEARAVTYGLEYWALSFISKIEIVEPQEVRQRVKSLFENSPY